MSSDTSLQGAPRRTNTCVERYKVARCAKKYGVCRPVQRHAGKVPSGKATVSRGTRHYKFVSVVPVHVEGHIILSYSLALLCGLFSYSIPFNILSIISIILKVFYPYRINEL